MVQQAPPVTLLRAFEAAGRTGSFTAAAAELFLTPSAISHAIHKLEQQLGVSLFERDGRAVRLTPDGDALMLHIGRGFEELRRGIEAVSSQAPGNLRLHCAPSFAAKWLSPRLPDFLSQHPGLEIRLAAGTDYLQFQSDEFDADIVYGLQQQGGLVMLPLGKETITPLCTPQIAEAIREPRDLLEQHLIEGYNRHVRWSMWFAANGLTALPRCGARFDRSFMVIAAAADGIGVALESTRLAEREIASGRLVAPLAGRAKDISVVDHHLAFPQIAKSRRPLRLFIAWLERELDLKSEHF